MTKQQAIQLFSERKVRSVWDDEQEKWFFSIVDVVAVLTDSADPKQYIKRVKARDPELNANWGTICTLLRLTSSDGKKHQEMTSDIEGIFRLIQSIPSPKAEYLVELDRFNLYEKSDLRACVPNVDSNIMRVV